MVRFNVDSNGFSLSSKASVQLRNLVDKIVYVEPLEKVNELA